MTKKKPKPKKKHVHDWTKGFKVEKYSIYRIKGCTKCGKVKLYATSSILAPY